MALAGKKSSGKSSGFDANSAVVLSLSLALFFIGIGATYLFQLPLAPISTGVHPALDLVLVVALMYVLGLLFFGQLAPTAMLLLGLMYGGTISTNPLQVLLVMIPALIAVHAGNITGRLVYADLEGIDNLFEKKRRIAVQVATALCAAVAFGFVLWALDLLGIVQNYILPAVQGISLGLPF